MLIGACVFIAHLRVQAAILLQDAQVQVTASAALILEYVVLLSNQCHTNCQYVPSNTNVVTMFAGRTILSVLVVIAALLYLIGYAVKLFTFNVELATVLVIDGNI